MSLPLSYIEKNIYVYTHTFIQMSPTLQERQTKLYKVSM